jgi:hypothetical protein
MQNIVSAEVDHVPGTFKPDDLLYPCDAVANDIRHDCYPIHTSYMLWKTASDYTKVFSLCDRVQDGLDKVCYQSMGRDISGSYLLDVKAVISHCDMGQAALRSYCIVGASLNAVYNDHDTANATKLCDAVDPQYRSACTTARDQAASTL